MARPGSAMKTLRTVTSFQVMHQAVRRVLARAFTVCVFILGPGPTCPTKEKAGGGESEGGAPRGESEAGGHRALPHRESASQKAGAEGGRGQQTPGRAESGARGGPALRRAEAWWPCRGT